MNIQLMVCSLTRNAVRLRTVHILLGGSSAVFFNALDVRLYEDIKS